ncbi:MAG: bifunctional folylpolyglutamate synthase/dihydrofolate synthase [Bacteroidetes bacterium]|nr:bifunctional folylpolyglutamate synthase/dihydrofolate synthase [Bacteroidota bacterium]
MDLQNIRSLMEYSGNQHRGLRAVHVAGTNGKGSTCAAIASVLTSMGYRTGLYTSPHILSLTERIRIDGRQIAEADLAGLTEFFEPKIVELKATYFEALTAIMFKHFSDNRVDYAVIETGLGGRLDATNIIDPIVSVVTGIGLDHTELLGTTVEQIASEKAGIIKRDRPAVINVNQESVRNVFKRVASESNSAVYFVDDVSHYIVTGNGVESSSFDARVFGIDYPGLKIGLGGKHQVKNAATALSALHLIGNSGIKIERDAIYKGFEEIRRNTGIRGRLEVISHDPLVVLDVGHNPDGIQAVLESLSEFEGRPGTLLFAAMRDKDVKSMLSILRERFANIILTQLQVGRSLNVAELNKLADDIKLKAPVFGNSTDALRAALNQTSGDSFLLISGSHYLAGETLPLMEKTVFDFESL